MKNAEEKETAKILFDAKKKAGLHKPITYNRECGLSKQEWELDNLADEIVASDSSLERIGILRKFIEQYATIREKETAIGFLMYHLGKSEALAQYQRDIYERKFDKWHKHKEG